MPQCVQRHAPELGSCRDAPPCPRETDKGRTETPAVAKTVSIGMAREHAIRSQPPAQTDEHYRPSLCWTSRSCRPSTSTSRHFSDVTSPFRQPVSASNRTARAAGGFRPRVRKRRAPSARYSSIVRKRVTAPVGGPFDPTYRIVYLMPFPHCKAKYAAQQARRTGRRSARR